MDRSTIAAVATPLSPGGIGIVRISGPDAVGIALSLFRRGRDGQPLSRGSIDSHRVYHGYVFDGPDLVDEVLLVFMLAPHSYTMEDVAEIHAHGGPAVLATILDLVLDAGAEPAGPGEFTKRAFLNGRIDLTQAEAVADIIEAASLAEVKSAAATISGRLKQEILSIRGLLLDLLAGMEASIDFSDQAGEVFDQEDASRVLLLDVLPALDRLMERHRAFGRGGREFDVVIVGAPNVGKSTLLNRLLGYERAIVSDTPGTTRDLVDGPVFLGGRRMLFTDTAGLRDRAGDQVEKKGMDLAAGALERADLAVFVVDAAKGFLQEDMDAFARLSPERCIVVVNKTDLPGAKGFSLPPELSKASRVVRVSALYGYGMDELEGVLVQMADKLMPAPGAGAAVPNARHHASLVACRSAVFSAARALEESVPVDMVAIDIKDAVSRLDEIVGESADAGLLDAVFERFCVGK